ncbi:MAG: M48 family metallopeptidase [Planctomycetes bacterium]|nr:M48 family metallopeptidase [Planctomycetota bacterium]MBL7008458.1 M48 family metallopeptidase [Planctomycetota bacterium]
MRTTPPRLSPLLLLVVLAAACATVPGTGRRQLKLMSLDQEMTLGREAYSEAMSSSPVIQSGADYEMVQRIGERVARAARKLYPNPARSFDWEINLIDEPRTVNAWALPGGKSAVYSGLLTITGDEDSLAVVVGHEVAHAIAHHGAERMSQQMGLSGGMIVAGLILQEKETDPDKAATIMAALGVGSTLGVMLPFSRLHESEADELGLYIAAAAGYDPRASIGLWERMASAGGDGPPEFLSTHPSEETRIQRLRKAMPKAMRYYNKAQREMGISP